MEIKRLTRKTMFGDYGLESCEKNATAEAINLLGKLEDIQDELGMPLDKFIECLEKGIVTGEGYIDTYYLKIRIKPKNPELNCFIYDSISRGHFNTWYYSFKDFGVSFKVPEEKKPKVINGKVSIGGV